MNKMSWMFFTEIKLLARKIVLKVSLFPFFIIIPDSYEAQKFTDTGKWSTLIHTKLFQFFFKFQVFSKFLLDIHNLKRSSYFYVMGKKFPAACFCLF